MRGLASVPPFSPTEPVTEVLHGVQITDPYRWLEDQNSARTRQWIEEQTRYARGYLDHIPGRERIRERIREFLAVETCDSFQKVGNRYFFRKRLPDQEQPCICLREGAEGQDQLLVDPAARGTGKYTAVKPLCVSPDERLLLYEVKHGGERTGTFELLDIESRRTLPDVLTRGNLRGFAFAPDGKGFYYVHEPFEPQKPVRRAVYQHRVGTKFDQDREIFCAESCERLRLFVFSGGGWLGILVYRFLDKMYTDFYLWPLNSECAPEPLFTNRLIRFEPLLLNDRILALTDDQAANLRIVEVHPREDREGSPFVEIVPESECRIFQWATVADHIFISYIRQARTEVRIFDFVGRKIGEVPVGRHETLRLTGTALESELLFEAESFTEPVGIFCYSLESDRRTLLARRNVPFESSNYSHTEVWFTSKDGTQVSMFIVGRHELLESGSHPMIMTSYGGYGVPMTPQFSIFVAFLLEHGCLFALPNIRGGSEFGAQWHNAARRRKRHVALADFLCAAEWLVKMGRTSPGKLAIFGGSNGGLLVGAALALRPDLFRAAVCMVPLLDMLRYHLFDDAHIRIDEYGTADDPDDFAALLKYSPYHRIAKGIAYPATMIVSGDADTNCNPLHARKMTARLQQANVSPYPIILNYSEHRGHSPTLPLSDRIEGLTDRMAFLCDQLQLVV